MLKKKVMKMMIIMTMMMIQGRPAIVAITVMQFSTEAAAGMTTLQRIAKSFRSSLAASAVRDNSQQTRSSQNLPTTSPRPPRSLWSFPSLSLDPPEVSGKPPGVSSNLPDIPQTLPDHYVGTGFDNPLPPEFVPQKKKNNKN